MIPEIKKKNYYIILMAIAKRYEILLPKKKNQNKQTNKHAKKYNWVNPHNLQALQFYYH